MGKDQLMKPRLPFAASAVAIGAQFLGQATSGLVVLSVWGSIPMNGPLTARAAVISVQVPVKVNLYPNSGIDKAAAISNIKDANKLLKQAGFLLVPVKFDDIPAGGGGGPAAGSKLDRTRRDSVREFGGKELKDKTIIPNQRGIKMSFVEKVNIDNDDVVGVGLHENPTLIVQNVAGSTTKDGITTSNTGETIAHELAHILTIAPPKFPNNGHSTGADDIMKADGFGGRKFTDDQIKEMQTQRYVRGKCATQFKQAFPAIKDPEQFGAAANINNGVGGTALTSLQRVDLTSLDANVPNLIGGDTSNINANIMVNGVLPTSGTVNLTYALGIDTDHSTATGISYGGQAGIDRIAYITAMGNSSALAMTGTVVDTDSLGFPVVGLLSTPAFVTENEFNDALGGPPGADFADPAATGFHFDLPKSFLGSLASADLAAVAASVNRGIAPTADTILSNTTDLDFNTRAYLDDPTLSTFGTGVPTPGQPYPFSVSGLKANDTFNLLLDGDTVFSGMLDGTGSFNGSFPFPLSDPNTVSYFLTAQDSTGEFAYNTSCPIPEPSSIVSLAVGLAVILVCKRRR
jgi:hypothetical protein